MKEAYIVTWEDYESTEVEAVFLSSTEAREYFMGLTVPKYGYYRIVRYPIGREVVMPEDEGECGVCNKREHTCDI